MVHELPLPLVEGRTTVPVGCSIAKEGIVLLDHPKTGFSGDGGYCGRIAGAKSKTLLR